MPTTDPHTRIVPAGDGTEKHVMHRCDDDHPAVIARSKEWIASSKVIDVFDYR
jgi:hypothetical protein